MSDAQNLCPDCKRAMPAGWQALKLTRCPACAQGGHRLRERLDRLMGALDEVNERLVQLEHDAHALAEGAVVLAAAASLLAGSAPTPPPPPPGLAGPVEPPGASSSEPSPG